MTDSSHCSVFLLDHGVRIHCMRLPNHRDEHRAGWHEWAAPDDQDEPEMAHDEPEYEMAHDDHGDPLP